MRVTSLLAYMDTEEIRQTQQEIILQLFDERGPSCIADIAAALGMRTSSVSARLNALKELGEIREIGKAKSKTTNRLAIYYATDAHETGRGGHLLSPIINPSAPARRESVSPQKQ